MNRLRLSTFVAIALAPGAAQAHFILVAPAASTEQTTLGDPQKAPPCGDDGTAVATAVVTDVAPGSTITITIDETIFHPGHYRVALAVNDISELPPPPPVTPADTPCGSAPIQAEPEFPVLADGVLVHTEPFSGPQSFEVTIPADVSCESCTLQIIQFMSDHALNDPGGCYYHHCATLRVQDQAGGGDTSSDGGGSSDGGDGSTSAPVGETGSDPSGAPSQTDSSSGESSESSAGSDASEEEGCACTIHGEGHGPSGWLGLGLVVSLLRRRRSDRLAGLS